MDAPAIPITPQILQFLECFLVGIVLMCFMSGWVIAQGVSYFQNFGRTDKMLFKALVGYCMALVTLYTACYMAYTILTYASHFGNILYGLTPNKLVIACVFITPFIDGAVSIFYAFRAYRVLQNSIIVAVIAGLVIAFQIGVGLFFGCAEALAANWRSDYRVTLSGPMNLIALAATDAVLTSMLVFGLLKARKQGTSQNTSKLVWRLVATAVEVNAFPTFFQILALICWYATNFVYLAFTPCLPIIYVATLLIWLQARQSTRMQLGHASSSPLSVQVSRNRAPSVGQYSPASAVRVQTMRHVHVESDKVSEDSASDLEKQPSVSSSAVPIWLN